MNFYCWLFGHTFVESFKYKTCLRCGLRQKKILKGIAKELDLSAKMELDIYTELLLIKAKHDTLPR